MLTDRHKDAITLLRIPFSIYLMPVFMMALAYSSPDLDVWQQQRGSVITVFILLHFFVYPASNGFNSYYDKDEGSIGGLENPPKVNKLLYYYVIALDILTFLVAASISWSFLLGTVGYVLVSKAYSHPWIRLKKYPFLSTASVTIFQGAYTFLLVQWGVGNSWDYLISTHNLLTACVATLFLAGSYPITQIYQHEEDLKRQDITLSLLLGIWGTFIWTACAFFLAISLLFYVHWSNGTLYQFIIFMLATLPILVTFIRWVWSYNKWGNRVITYRKTMLLNQISSVCLTAAFFMMMYIKIKT